jgi:hypothetical protein
MPSTCDIVQSLSAATMAEEMRRDRPSLAALQQRARLLAAQNPTLHHSVIGRIPVGGQSYDVPRLVFTGPAAGHDPIRIALFAGIHGDEPAGCTALLDLAADLSREPHRAAGYELWFYPLVNPTGYEQSTRANTSGKDLNREFWCGSIETEVQVFEGELRAQSFAGIITLHADDTGEGMYGYAHGRTLNEALLEPALGAAAKHLPIDTRAVIDGFPARAGLICDCFAGVLSAPPEQKPQPFDIIIETPAFAPFDLQVNASVAALESILAAYPGFISYAQDL